MLAASESSAVAAPRNRFLERRVKSGIARRSQQRADARHDLVEFAARRQIEAARPRERNAELLDEAARPWRHHQHAVGEKYRLEDAVSDEEHGLAVRHPYL